MSAQDKHRHWVRDGRMITCGHFLGKPMSILGLDSEGIAIVFDEDDAKLVAAAPELLAALEACERVFVGWVHDANPHKDLKPGESMELDAAVLMLDQARAALSKARGA